MEMTRLYQVVSAISQTLTLSFGVFLIVGGAAGFHFAKSVPSLAGGGISGLILLVASLKNPRSLASRVAVLLTTGFLSGFFFFRYLRTGKTFPAGLGAGAGLGVAVLNLTLLFASTKSIEKTIKDE